MSNKAKKQDTKKQDKQSMLISTLEHFGIAPDGNCARAIKKLIDKGIDIIGNAGVELMIADYKEVELTPDDFSRNCVKAVNPYKAKSMSARAFDILQGNTNYKSISELAKDNLSELTRGENETTITHETGIKRLKSVVSKLKGNCAPVLFYKSNGHRLTVKVLNPGELKKLSG